MGTMENKKERLNTGPCLKDMAESVIAFATGVIEDKDRRMDILIHILTCPSCYSLYEDILEYENEMQTEDVKSSIFETIKVKIVENFIVPLRGLEMENFSAAVLDDNKSTTAEFKLNTSDGEMTALLMVNEKGLDLEVTTEKELEQIYLLGNNKCTKQYLHNKKTVFESITPGSYALSTELKNFIFLEIESD